VRGTSGPKVELNLPRLFFKQLDIIGASCGSQEEFRHVTGLVADGLPWSSTRCCPWRSTPRALERLAHGHQLGKIVLDPESLVMTTPLVERCPGGR
jgi:zinc-binding alcohol dehydrogenase/oxidoreductase